jgi:PAS domain S-box-containing protein
MERLKRNELEHVVGALTEGVIITEADHRITFANRAALTMHGAEKLDELGETIGEYRKRFVLRYRNQHLVKPEEYPMERVLAGEVFDEVIVEVERRDDPDQKWTHRIRSMVVGEKDHPDLLVLVIADVSAQFEAQERFERTFAANPAPALILRLADQQFIKSNVGFLEMTGYEREQIVGRFLKDLDVFRQADRRELALQKLQEGTTIPQMEAYLPLPHEKDKLVVVAGQPLEVDEAACMLLTFADLEPRRQALGKLKRQEEQFEKLFRLAPVPMSVWRKSDRTFLDINEAFCTTTGFKAKHIIGQSALAVGLASDPETLSQFNKALEEDGRFHALECRLNRKDGEPLIALASAETIVVNDEECLLSAFQDISSKKRTETELMRAIDAVMSDASWFSQAVVEKLASLREPSGTSNRLPTAVADLSTREREVIERLCRGMDDKAIAADLGVSPNTVRNHVAALFRKIVVNRRSAAVVWARDRGIGGEMPTKAKRRRR